MTLFDNREYMTLFAYRKYMILIDNREYMVLCDNKDRKGNSCWHTGKSTILFN